MKTPTTQTTQTDLLYTEFMAARDHAWAVSDSRSWTTKEELYATVGYQEAVAAEHAAWVAYLEARDAAKS
jgi:hypothetical protein